MCHLGPFRSVISRYCACALGLKDRERGGAARQYRLRGGLAGNRGWAVDDHRYGFRIDATHNVGDPHPVGSVRSESACVLGLRDGALDGL